MVLWVRVVLIVLILDSIGALGSLIGVAVLLQARQNEESIQLQTTAIASLNSALDRQAAAARQQAHVTQEFIDEINFICTVSATRAVQLHVHVPPGICSLSTP